MSDIHVRNTTVADFEPIHELSLAVYPDMAPWSHKALQSHVDHFAEGQIIAVDGENGRICGMAASLVIDWDEYDRGQSWRNFTDNGMFTNHDPTGRTLYGAEVMVHPDYQGRGVGTLLYAARRNLCRRLGLRRIRAGARIPGYQTYAEDMDAEAYVRKVSRFELYDPTLSFQLKRGFHAIAVVHDYLKSDEESLGYAVLIEWLNPEQTTQEERAAAQAIFDTRPPPGTD